MILNQISYLDCIAFLVFLIPQLLLHVNTFTLIVFGIQALPFLCIILPVSFIRDRLLVPKEKQTPFVRQASPFQDFVIRCVRYAFANVPVEIGNVFFSKPVSLPFLRFRLLRHGYLRCPVKWQEVGETGFRGLLIRHDETKEPDVVVYYCHGGGFAMGSAYFYLEPLISLFTLLKTRYKNPAVFALEYSLVPKAAYPVQLHQTFAGYRYILSMVSGDADRVCVAGDSAGGTLILSLLLLLAKESTYSTPGYATLISPWVTLKSERDRNTASDFLDRDALHKYGSQYAGDLANIKDPIVSPGSCTDLSWWSKASPTNGLYITFGEEEVFGPEIRAFVKFLRKAGVGVSVKEEPGAVHAWVIARLFLEDGMQERIWGMRELVKAIATNIEVRG